MNGSTEVSRRDFLRIIPQYLAKSVHTFSEGFFGPPGINTQTIEAEAIDHCAKIAKIDINRCLAWGGGSCQFCYLACPLRDKAIRIEDQQPIINSAICDGCAKCVTACQTVNSTSAIVMTDVKNLEIKSEDVYENHAQTTTNL